MGKLRVLLGDDHSLILEGVRRLLENHHDVIGWADNGRALVQAAVRLSPDVVVLDASMPILNGIDAAREIKKLLPATAIVFLSMHSNAIYLRKALEAGASGGSTVGAAADAASVAVLAEGWQQGHSAQTRSIARVQLSYSDFAHLLEAPGS